MGAAWLELTGGTTGLLEELAELEELEELEALELAELDPLDEAAELLCGFCSSSTGGSPSCTPEQVSGILEVLYQPTAVSVHLSEASSPLLTQ